MYLSLNNKHGKRCYLKLLLTIIRSVAHSFDNLFAVCDIGALTECLVSDCQVHHDGVVVACQNGLLHVGGIFFNLVFLVNKYSKISHQFPQFPPHYNRYTLIITVTVSVTNCLFYIIIETTL